MSQVEDIIRYAREGANLLFHAPDGTAYATVEVDGHLETHAIRSVRFTDWLLIRYFRQHGRAPNTQLLTDALNTVRAMATYDGPEMPVYIRVAEHNGDVYVDLGHARWDAVRITREGFEVVTNSPVRFVRKAGFAPLPYPEAGGSINELRPLLNVGSDSDFMLIVAWTAFSLSPWGPFPVLVLQGEQGSAKSTTVRVLRALVDPAVEALNAWCELSGEDLRGRCPRTRVGLLTNPQGKGTDSWSMWTPSSPHFTLWSTTSASLIRQHLRSQVRKHPCVQAR